MQAREALRAAMGLEKCATVLAGKMAADGGEQARAVVSDMTGCLGVLKGTLWQLLVLASHEDDDRTHHPSSAELNPAPPRRRMHPAPALSVPARAGRTEVGVRQNNGGISCLG